MACSKDRDWDDCLGEIILGYRRRPVIDGKSPFSIHFGIGPRLAVEPPQLDLFAFNTDLAREFEISIAKSARASRIVSSAPEKWTNKFDVVEKILVRGGGEEAGSKIESTDWFGPFIVKEENHPRYGLRTDDRRKFRHLIHARRLGPYVERECGPSAAMI